MAAGIFTGSLATPYRVTRADSSENQWAQKSRIGLLLVGALDTAATTLTTAYQQISSTFDIANCPAAWFDVDWTYGAAAALLSVRFKISGDLTNDSFRYAESVGAASSGTSVVDVMTLTYAKANGFDNGTTQLNIPISILEPRRPYIQLWAKADSATTNTLAGYVGGGTHG